ncbi:MAG TPA: hypothetical protein VFX92_09715 [Candidatus Krumholzibacteria bacterium]|nr:hypothetical protein [Candidatus Krumholzibacteria bacterium]
MKRLAWILAIAVAATACSSVKNVVVKDIPLEEQQAILKEYKDRIVWTRVVLQDLGEGGSIPRDEKVRIVDVDMHYEGAVTVATLHKKNKVRQGLSLERPLSQEKIDGALEELFWFEDPVLRHVAYIRKYGKKTARAIMDHEVYVGMAAEAALESWGNPARRNVSDIGGSTNEQWVYPTATANKNRYIYIIGGKVSRWDE